jgi:hypothetical protein
LTTFTLTLDLAGHEHPENPTAQHAKVREMLGLAIQAVGAGTKRHGDLTIPSWDHARNTGGHVKIGSWEFSDAKKG